ncbi:hypothetical protein H1R20_g874, partial [Candolleomyces eurysporus]
MKLHPEFAPIAFIAAFSLLLPLPWHWRARNVATLSIIAWLFASNMIFAIDAVIWADNVRVVAEVWCDVSTKLIIGANFALPAACLCLCMHLEYVSSSRMANTTLRDKKRRQIFEACVCVGLPILFMGLHVIVQGHRFDIIEGYGCRPTTYFSIPAIFIVWLPPIVMAAACLVLSVLALRNFVLRRLTFAADLKSRNTGLTTSRYLRLISMAIVQMVWSLAVTSYTLYVTTVGIPLRPWTNWDDVHSDFWRADLFPAILAPKKLRDVSYALWWMVPATTFIFVAFFSFGQDALEEYKKCFVWIKTRIFRIPPPSEKGLPRPFLLSPSGAKTPRPSAPITLDISSNFSTTCKSFSTDDETACGSYAKHESFSTATTQVKHDLSPPSFYVQSKAIGSYSDLSPTTSTVFSDKQMLASPPAYSSPSSQCHPRGAIDINPFLDSSPTSTLAPRPELQKPLPPIPRTSVRDGASLSPRPFTYPSQDPRYLHLPLASQFGSTESIPADQQV